MSKTTQALLWEFWRPNKWRFVMTFCVMTLLPAAMVLANVPWRSLQELSSGSLSDLQKLPWQCQMALIWIDAMICLLGVGYSIGFPTRSYTLPISTRQLTRFRLLPAALTCSGMYLVLAASFNGLFNSGLPYAGPAFTYGASYLFGYAVLSRVHGRDNLKALAGLCVGILVGFWIAGHYEPSWRFGPSFQWPGLSAVELMFMTAMSLLAWWLAESGFQLDRKGRGWAQPTIRSWESETRSNSRPYRLSRLRSPFAALFWQEWRRDGWLWPLAIACAFGMLAITMFISRSVYGNQLPSVDTVPEIFSIAVAFIGFAAFLPWCVGVVTAQGRKSQVDKPLPTSLSTLPISDALLAWVSISRSLCSVAMSCVFSLFIGAIWLLVACLQGDGLDWTSIAARLPPQSSLLSALNASILWFTFVAWFATTVGTATGLSGRSWIALLPVLFFPLWIGTFLTFAVLHQLLGSETTEVLGISAFTILLLALAGGMLAAYKRALNRNVIGKKSLLTGLAILTIIEAGVIFAYHDTSAFRVTGNSELQFAFFWRIGLFLALAAATPALVPLSVHFNRHR